MSLQPCRQPSQRFFELNANISMLNMFNVNMLMFCR